ncbi:helix-turn-helix transcriptional regulator [Sphaerisporangium sp. TRM90804]|uniref:helix-turn-helix domain-containing protein n=1 Tax=Sphaerisporangium sp. TRM90804 TaxID=3031113 RepID=UPI00244BA665|nr:helix-turn-helix transcriptional regulator [Sphaerisporangium sp. TRM90804]MDH2428658.1 helix-turn-helix transcriptional regulator [Sphaerisporangium sp. TRM90804]
MTSEVPSLRQRWLGAKLAELRLAAGITSLAVAAERCRRSTASLSRIENGLVGIPPRDIPPILDAYGVTETVVRERLMAVASEVQLERRGWWVEHGDALAPSYVDRIRLESTATELWTYETCLVPGLLQTEAYARTFVSALGELGSVAELDEFIAVRMNRRAILTADRPVTLRAVVSEAFLRHPIGGEAVFRDQLEHLRDVAGLPNVTLRILRFSGRPNPGLFGSFTVIRLPSVDVAHVETMNTDAYIEDERSVGQYLDAFDRLCQLALSPEETIEILAESAVNL